MSLFYVCFIFATLQTRTTINLSHILVPLKCFSGDDLYKLSAFYQILYHRCLYPVVYDDLLIKYCLNQICDFP